MSKWLITILVLFLFAAVPVSVTAQAGKGPEAIFTYAGNGQWVQMPDRTHYVVPEEAAALPPEQTFYPRPNCYAVLATSCPVNALDINASRPDGKETMTWVAKDQKVSIWGSTGSIGTRGRYRSTGVDVDQIPFDGWIDGGCLKTFGDCSRSGTLWFNGTYNSPGLTYPGYQYQVPVPTPVTKLVPPSVTTVTTVTTVQQYNAVDMNQFCTNIGAVYKPGLGCFAR